jgi:hypothetical protein
MAVTDPEYPALQEHPPGSVLPSEWAGQDTAEQELVKKGLVVDADTNPE